MVFNLFLARAWVLCHSVMSNSLWPHGLKSARLLCPWNFPGRNTGVDCHFLLQGSFPTQDRTCVYCSSWVSCFARWILYHSATWEAPVPSTELLKPLREVKVSCYVIKVTSEKLLRKGGQQPVEPTTCLEGWDWKSPSTPLPRPQGREKGLEVESIANG